MPCVEDRLWQLVLAVLVVVAGDLTTEIFA